MPFHYRFIHNNQVVLIRALGTASVEDWEGLATLPFPEAAAEPCLLIDLRPRMDLPTGAVAREIGRAMHRTAARFCAIALVARPGAQYGLARSAELLSDLRQKEIQTFLDLRSAWNWLHTQRPDK